MITIMMLSMVVNLLFLTMKHPISMGFMLIMQTIITATLSGMIMKSFWISYMLLITMTSGMLVLFMYMSSIASNEKFKYNNKTMIIALLMLMSMSVFLFLSEKMVMNNYFSMEMLNPYKGMEMFSTIKMFNSHMYITIMMVMYLFFTMIVSSFIVNLSEGPLRSSKYE